MPDEIGEKPISFLYLKIIFEVSAMSQRRAVVSVVGKDQVGIIAKVTTVLANENVNIFDISQTILQDFFTMMMIVDVTNLENLEALQQKLTDLGSPLGLTINVQLEEIFHAMHRV
jgi:ACT domain-containing protein